MKQTNNNYLVVGGIINTGQNGITTITLSRTFNLTDTAINNPELLANVQIESKTGNKYPVIAQATPGTYASSSLNLDNSDEYRLDISTSDGDQFQSDFVAVKQTPPIDSITWRQDTLNNDEVVIYANTHDPNNSSRYYWWEYVETYQYEVPLQTPYGLSNDSIFGMLYPEQITICWQTQYSSDLLVGTSRSLSSDVISRQPLLTIPNQDVRLDYRYSMLVRQYSLSSDAYSYWAGIKATSQSLGTLFDVQPSQLIGNIRSVVNASEPVVGFVSAAQPQEMRLFINQNQLTNWNFDPFAGYICNILETSQNPVNPDIWNYPDPLYQLWYFESGGGMKVAKKTCLDCRLQGGVNSPPSFW